MNLMIVDVKLDTIEIIIKISTEKTTSIFILFIIREYNFVFHWLPLKCSSLISISIMFVFFSVAIAVHDNTAVKFNDTLIWQSESTIMAAQAFCLMNEITYRVKKIKTLIE